MKTLLRLYPRSWRKRYGREMEVLLDGMPAGVGVGLDLVLGAASAYATVIRGNRILTAAGAFLHGVCVAMLLQAILFVSFILYAQRSGGNPVLVEIGPVRLATFTRPFLFGNAQLFPLLGLTPAMDFLPSLALLVTLVAALVLVLASPRLLRTLR